MGIGHSIMCCEVGAIFNYTVSNYSCPSHKYYTPWRRKLEVDGFSYMCRIPLFSLVYMFH